MKARHYCRSRQARPWKAEGYDLHYYALAVVVGVQGVRLLVRPTIIDGIVFVACVVAMAPWENYF
ncbi:MAG: hypothetical protein KGZ50_05505 [Peptococcaceae bacterium]|nr:hypothetical protein [Peptococcaceae bacterium]